MAHRSLPPFPIKPQPTERRGEERDEDGEGVGGLGGNKSPDNTDIVRGIESDKRRANTEGGQRGEAMTDLKKETGEVRCCAAKLCRMGK